MLLMVWFWVILFRICLVVSMLMRMVEGRFRGFDVDVFFGRFG